MSINQLIYIVLKDLINGKGKSKLNNEKKRKLLTKMIEFI